MPLLNTLATSDSNTNQNKFGAFEGVFLPTFLTILGAVMYLRTGWVVGHAGLGGAIAIILLSNLITITTALSISSIATNIRVGAGGPFSIVSQALGLEAGGSVSVPFYLAQSISVTFYIFAFGEGWARIFPDHPQTLVLLVAFAVCLVISYISISLANKIRYPILIIIVVSLIAILLGSFPRFGPGLTHSPDLWGDFAAGNFWVIFAVFFPAVTGVLTGVNMSGILKDPRRSIPLGTLGASVLTMFIYLGLAVWVSMAATPGELIDNLTILVDKAAWGPAILAGIVAATFSSALNSMVGAPQILQAIAAHNIVPRSDIFARQTPAGNPRPALILTASIGLIALIFGLLTGGLNAIAPLMTMIFLVTYAVLNGIVMLEQALGLISFRPMFKIHRSIPIIGLGGCFVAMFLISPIFGLVAIVAVLILYDYLSRHPLKAPWEDVRSGLFVSLAEWAAKRVLGLPKMQERAWQPNLLVPVESPQQLAQSYPLLRALIHPRGTVHILGLYQSGQKETVKKLASFVDMFAEEDTFSRVSLLEVEDPKQGLYAGLEIMRGAFFHPNTLFLRLTSDIDESTLQSILDQAIKNDMGAIFAKYTEAAPGHENTINIWVREQSPNWEIGLHLGNIDLALLLAYQLAYNWHGMIRLITLVNDATEAANGQAFLDQLIDAGRMPPETQTTVAVGSLESYLPGAPQADLNIFGLQKRVTLAFMEQITETIQTPCLFVRESGLESALA